MSGKAFLFMSFPIQKHPPNFELMEIIRDWLNGTRNYRIGVKLYLEYGNDAVLKSLFKKESETAFKRQRLEEALKDIVYKQSKSKAAGKDETEDIAAQVILSQDETERTEQLNAEELQGSKIGKVISDNRWGDGSDVVLNTLRREWETAFSEMKMLQHRLLDIPDDLERCAAAHKIIELDKQIDELYAKRDHYKEKGKLPHEKDEKRQAIDPVKWPVKLQNAERYIREYKVKLKKDPTNERYARKVKEHEETRDYYKKLLKIE